MMSGTDTTQEPATNYSGLLPHSYIDKGTGVCACGLSPFNELHTQERQAGVHRGAMDRARALADLARRLRLALLVDNHTDWLERKLEDVLATYHEYSMGVADEAAKER